MFYIIKVIGKVVMIRNPAMPLRFVGEAVVDGQITLELLKGCI
jgi:hypothetical protein